MPGLSHARAYGALLLIVALWGSYPALAKLALQDVPPVMLVALRGVVASAFPYQAILGAVAHVWWYRAVEVVGPSLASVFMNLQPVVGIALAAVLLAEGVGAWQIAGGILVLAGVVLTTGVGLRAR